MAYSEPGHNRWSCLTSPLRSPSRSAFHDCRCGLLRCTGKATGPSPVESNSELVPCPRLLVARIEFRKESKTLIIPNAWLRVRITPPMRNITQSWKMSRIFGIQPVGCLHRRMSPRVGVFAWVTSAELSRWTVDEGRLADLPTLLVDDQWGAARTLRSCNRSGVFCTFVTNVDGFASRRAFRARRVFPRPRSRMNGSSGVYARHQLPRIPPFPLETAKNH